MQVDIYRRPEAGNKVSYLVVPKGQPIPEEATNVDWALRKQDVHIDECAQHLDTYEIDRPSEQIAEKGYAITGVKHQVPVGDGRIPRAWGLSDKAASSWLSRNAWPRTESKRPS